MRSIALTLSAVVAAFCLLTATAAAHTLRAGDDPAATTKTAETTTAETTTTESTPTTTETTTTEATTTETTPATTETTTVATTTSGVTPATAAPAGAAAAVSKDQSSDTPWGWIAFAILATAVVTGLVVHGLHRRSGGKGTAKPST